MKRKAEKVRLEPAANWSRKDRLRSVSLGAGGEVCVLWADDEQAGFPGGIPGGKREDALDYEAAVVRGERVDWIAFPKQKWDYHFIEIINDGELLLASSRSVFYEGGKEERNGRVFDFHGSHLRSFCLGDGINQLSADSGGVIWTGYFDEGVYGNNYWDPPIGEKGLIGWDTAGRMQEWHEQSEDHWIDDCYALNVLADGEVWFYFYSDFRIGIRKNGETVYRIPDIEGASVFAVHEDWILFSGGYGDRGSYYLGRRNGDRYRTQQELVFTDSRGKRIRALLTCARGAKLLLQTEVHSYVFDLAEWIKNNKE